MVLPARARFLKGTALVLLGVLALVVWTVHDAGTKRAEQDDRCSARVMSRRGLFYRAGADPALDRPAHVRAASGVAWVGELLGVVQDDANFIALVEPESGAAIDIPLPVGPNGQRLFEAARGTKGLKLDLEACFAYRQSPAHGSQRAVLARASEEATARLDEGALHFVGLGSGSKRARERFVVLDFDQSDRHVQQLRVLDASAFYTQLRALSEFSGSELNVEGAVLRGQTLLLFQRGNGAALPGLPAVNAVGELDWPLFRNYLASQCAPSHVPPLGRVTQYDLGSVDGVPYTFTDAALAPNGRVLFLSSAEDSTDSVTDGTVHGTLIGELAPDGSARVAPLLDERGAALRLKAEGLVLDRKDPTRAWVVVDMDDTELASELLELALSFPR